MNPYHDWKPMFNKTKTKSIAVNALRPGDQFVGLTGTIFSVYATNVYVNGDFSVEFFDKSQLNSFASMTFSDPETMINKIVK